MTAFDKALYAFWSGFSYGGRPIPAYKSGYVPDGAEFPYITYETRAGDFFSGSTLSAIVWCRDTGSVTANAQRSAILDDVSLAIPAGGGHRLLFDGGMAMLYRADAFLTDYDDPDNGTRPPNQKILGGRIGYLVKFYMK